MTINTVARNIYRYMHEAAGKAPARVYVSQELLDLLKEDMRRMNRKAGVHDRPELEGIGHIYIVGVRLEVDPHMKLLRFE